MSREFFTYEVSAPGQCYMGRYVARDECDAVEAALEDAGLLDEIEEPWQLDRWYAIEVEDAPDGHRRLEGFNRDVILSVPHLDGLKGLELARQLIINWCSGAGKANYGEARRAAHRRIELCDSIWSVHRRLVGRYYEQVVRDPGFEDALRRNCIDDHLNVFAPDGRFLGGFVASSRRWS